MRPLVQPSLLVSGAFVGDLTCPSLALSTTSDPRRRLARGETASPNSLTIGTGRVPGHRPRIREKTVQYEAVESAGHPGEWRVEAIDQESDGEVYVTIFSGPKARERAQEYAEWKSASAGPRLKRAG